MEEIFCNGIYFIQSDKKEDGYHTKSKDGKIIKHDYVAPSIWHKLKYYLTYGYAMNTNTKSTAFLYFDKYSKNTVYSGAIVGDAVSIAKRIKKEQHSYLLSFTSNTYERKGEKLFIDLGEKVREIEFKENGRKLASKFNFKTLSEQSNEHSKSYIFTFLNWDDL